VFTGLVTAVGVVRAVVAAGNPLEPEAELEIELGPLAAGARTGDSIALSGACCTVVSRHGDRARFHLSAETLRRTWLGRARAGTRVNLEAALRAGEPLGGHLVQGHVDGLGEVVRPVGPAGGEWVVRIPRPLARYVVEKGSIALDGVSLTAAAVDGERVAIAVIPHTAAVTTIGTLSAGAPLHVEVDVLAKYVEKLLGPRLPG
jgi:riboflavin synthase